MFHYDDNKKRVLRNCYCVDQAESSWRLTAPQDNVSEGSDTLSDSRIDKYNDETHYEIRATSQNVKLEDSLSDKVTMNARSMNQNSHTDWLKLLEKKLVLSKSK